MASRRLDTRGHACPAPTLMAVQAMGRPGEPDEIVVLTDDPVCAQDIPFQAGRHGYRARTESVAPSEWEITLRREPQPEEPQPGGAEPEESIGGAA